MMEKAELKQKTGTVIFRMDERLKAQMAKQAESEGLSISGWLRRTVIKTLSN